MICPFKPLIVAGLMIASGLLVAGGAWQSQDGPDLPPRGSLGNLGHRLVNAIAKNDIERFRACWPTDSQVDLFEKVAKRGGAEPEERSVSVAALRNHLRVLRTKLPTRLATARERGEKLGVDWGSVKIREVSARVVNKRQTLDFAREVRIVFESGGGAFEIHGDDAVQHSHPHGWLFNDLPRQIRRLGDVRPKKKKDLYIPTAEEISAWVNTRRTTDFNMVKIPAGRYKLGDNSFRGNPERIVNLEKSFKTDRFEVTNHDWFMFLWATRESEKYFASVPIVMGDFNTDRWDETSKYFQYDYKTRFKHPVRSISYEEAVWFAKFLNKRLPTAVEWEIAARGPEGLRYPWGNQYTSADWKTKAQTSFMKSLDKTGRVDRGSIHYVNDTVAVDKLAAGQSPFGCYNMAGNVSEWTSTKMRTMHNVWKQRPLKQRPRAQVVKGGSFYSRQKGAMAAQFFELLPELVSDQFRVGFRCVRD